MARLAIYDAVIRTRELISSSILSSLIISSVIGAMVTENTIIQCKYVNCRIMVRVGVYIFDNNVRLVRVNDPNLNPGPARNRTFPLLKELDCCDKT